MVLTKAEIEASNDVIIECLDVPEWDIKSNGTVTRKGEVCIRVLQGTDRDAIEREWLLHQKEFGDGVPMPNTRARYVGLCLCDAKGVRLFSDSEVDKLGKRSSAALDRIFGAAQKLNGLTDEDVEELVGNSDGDQNA